MSSIPLATVLIYLFLLPGLLLQGGYSKGGVWTKTFRRKKKISSTSGPKHPTHPENARSFTEQLIKSSLTAIFLHFIWGLFFSVVLGKTPNYWTILSVIGGQSDFSVISNGVKGNEYYVIGYLCSILFLPPIMGRVFLSVVRGFQYDHHSKLFRFNDKWFYLIRGEIFSFAEFESEKSIDPNEIVAVMLVAQVDRFLYSGIVRFWYIDEKGELDRIVIDKVLRYVLDESGRFVTEEGGTGKVSQRIGAKLVVLDCSKCEFIGFNYIASPK